MVHPREHYSAAHIAHVFAVGQQVFPRDPDVPLDQPFINDSGTIQNILLGQTNSVAVIHSKANTVRANHYHKTDWHYAYVISGMVDYVWRERIPEAPIHHRRYEAGTSFFTPPLIDHAMAFPVDTVIVTCARLLRNHEKHESDVVRLEVPLCDPREPLWNGTNFILPVEKNK